LAGIRAEAAAGSQRALPILASHDPIAASSSRALSGEWGRAIVFELAGGEPAGGDPSVDRVRSSRLRMGEATTRGDGPLSMTEHGREAENNLGSEPQATRHNSGSADGGSQSEMVDPLRKQAAIEFGDLNGRRSDTAQVAATLASNTGDTDASSLAAAAAFEQFGDDGAARVESSAGAPWWRSWALAPLLMALALERITARRSRHPQTETPRMLIRTPLCWPQSRADERE
jgi:hypothetical protein